MDSLTADTHAETLAKLAPLLEEGRHEEALPFLELHRSKSDEPIWSYLMALCLACLARGTEGLPLLEKAAQSPDFKAHFGIPAEIHNLIKMTALNHLMFETSVENTVAEPWEVLQKYSQLLGHREYQAKAVVGRMKIEPENPAVIEDFTTIFEDAPNDKVIPILDEVVNARPSACQPRALLGSYLLSKGKTALAIRHLKTALESDPTAMEPHIYLGKIYSAQARFDDAEKELSLAMQKGKSPTVALLVELAHCQKATYRYEEALQTLFAALEINPPTFKHWDQLVDTAQTSGQRALLVEALRRAADKYPDDARLRQRFAMVAYGQGDPLAARDQLRATGIFENPTKDPALARLASEVAVALGEPGTAVHLLEALWKASPASPETSRLCGEALLLDNRAAEAEALLRETARNNPNDRALQVSWGRSLLALGDAERAYRAFSLASRLDPDDPEAMAEQGRAMLLLGMQDEAQNVLKESAKKVDPPLAVTLTGLGAVYERKNLRDIAHDFYRQALQRQEDRLEAACGLVRTRALDGSASFALDCQDLTSHAPSAFAKIKLFLTLLRATFIEQQPAEARALKDRVFPDVLASLDSDGYRSFLDNSEVRLLSKLAKDLESNGEPEKAREIWRYAVTSPLVELSQKASTELKRLDTYEPGVLPSTPAVPEATPTSPVASGGGDEDPLLSLLSTTLPSEGEIPLFDSEPVPTSAVSSLEADLFADDEAPTAESAADDDLFAVAPLGDERTTDDDVLDALFALEDPLQSGDAPLDSMPESPLSDEEQAGEREKDPIGEVDSAEPLAEAASHESEETSEADLFDLPFDAPQAAPAEPLDASSDAEGIAEDSFEDSLFAASTPTGESLVEEASPAGGADEYTEEHSFEIPPMNPVENEAAQELTAEPESSQMPGDPEVTEAPEVPVELASHEMEQPSASEASSFNETDEPSVTVSEDALRQEVPNQETPTSEIGTEPRAPVDFDFDVAPRSEAETKSEGETESEGQAEALTEDESSTVATDATSFAEPSPPELPAVVEPEFVSEATPEPSSSQLVREELLPIPMAADFSPLTRRQLHYHEAMAGGVAGGFVNTENLAHLLLQSAVGHEPPDPSSTPGSPTSTDLLQKALLESAGELERVGQFRGAARVLRTALLYQPAAADVVEALSRVQSGWASWLADQKEYAHAVGLVRESLQRQPENESAMAQLEAIYSQWMSWSADSGDTAARDLLAVYFDQERSALGQLRQQWQALRAATAMGTPPAPAASTLQAPPPVSPTSSVAPQVPSPASTSPSLASAPPSVASTPPSPAVPPPTAVASAPTAETVPPVTPVAAPALIEAAPPAVPAAPSSEPTDSAVFESKEEAIETLDAAPDDDSVAEGVFAIYADSMRDLTTLLKERSNSHPEQPAWLLLLARAFRRSGSETMAVIQYQKYIKVAPSPEAYEELAQTYEDLGKEDFAKMTRRKAERGG